MSGGWLGALEKRVVTCSSKVPSAKTDIESVVAILESWVGAPQKDVWDLQRWTGRSTPRESFCKALVNKRKQRLFVQAYVISFLELQYLLSSHHGLGYTLNRKNLKLGGP